MATEKNTDGEDASAEREAVKARLGDSLAAARELAKDAALLARQSRMLQERSRRAVAEARRLRDAPEPPPAPITVSAACRRVGVCERTLRHVLEEPEVKARVLHRNHRVGIYCRYTLLLPPDLVADLVVRFAAQKQSDK